MTARTRLKMRLLLANQLLDHEDYRAAAYEDSEGYLTIGIGRMIDARRGGGITAEEALYLLSNDIAKVEQQLDAQLPWWRDLNEVRQRVLLDMTFNLGIGGLLGFKNTLRAISENKYEEASEGMLASEWANQVGRRAQRLALMMRDGQDTL